MTTLSRYNNIIFAKHYDLGEQVSNNGDIEFYTKLLKNTGMKVLELGCGSGRITIPLRKAGVDITGLDFADEMIRLAQKKARKEKLKIKFIVADAATFRSDIIYDSIIFPYSSMVLLSKKQLAQLIKNLKYNLSRGGIFAFDLSVPNRNFRKLPSLSKSEWSRPVNIDGVSLRRRVIEKITPDRLNIERIYFWEATLKDGSSSIHKTKMKFLANDFNWYAGLFKKSGFTVKQRMVIKNVNKPVDHVFVVFKQA